MLQCRPSSTTFNRREGTKRSRIERPISEMSDTRLATCSRAVACSFSLGGFHIQVTANRSKADSRSISRPALAAKAAHITPSRLTLGTLATPNEAHRLQPALKAGPRRVPDRFTGPPGPATTTSLAWLGYSGASSAAARLITPSISHSCSLRLTCSMPWTFDAPATRT